MREFEHVRMETNEGWSDGVCEGEDRKGIRRLKHARMEINEGWSM